MSFFLVKMSDGSSSGCPGDCSGHGSCVRGNCVCEVKYSGGTCSDTNIRYFVGFSVVFFFVCAVSIAQLILCVRSEFHQLKKRSLAKACRLTVQKMLYLCMIVACGTRGVYYSIQRHLPVSLGLNLFNAYYPVIISGFSIIICFWAEAFHVAGLKLDRPCFLSKSSLAFTIFNVLMYLVCVAQFITTEVTDLHTKVYLYNTFTAFLVGLMFLVLIFFLIYGVELFYKVRGAFITTDQVQSSSVDVRQVTMSRFGLVSQASLQLLTSLFLLGDIMREKWENRLPVEGRNVLDVVFRVFELGVALWFTCCLWNWKSPSQLWILNPTRLLINENRKERRHLLSGRGIACYEAIEQTSDDLDAPRHECWICYDRDRPDVGPMIFPCQCKGDLVAVHHDCLKRWLIESSVDSQTDSPKCKLCGHEYTLATGRTWLPSGLTVRHWIQTTLMLSMMVGAPIGVYLVCLTEISPACKVLVIGLALVLEYVCLRLMGFNMLLVYRRARLATMTIASRPPSTFAQLLGEDDSAHKEPDTPAATA